MPAAKQEPLSEKWALLIGLHYQHQGESWRLVGPYRDVDSCKELLIEKYGFQEDHIIVMKDSDDTDDALRPTQINLRRVLKSFIQKEKDHVQYFFLYAGHSDQTDCLDGTEEDGKNEYIIPEDAFNDGDVDEDKVIIDDDLYASLVKPLTPNSRLVAILDACHSGTLLDLQHHRCTRIYHLSSKFRRMARRMIELAFEIDDRIPFDHRRLSSIIRPAKFCNGFCRRKSSTPQNVICVSASKDSESTYEDPKGASVTQAVIKQLRNNPQPRLKKFMREISKDIRAQNREMARQLKESFERTNPQLSSNTPLRMNSFLVL